ncbi:Zn-dependent protease [Allocoleopsis franciscana]|uniref:Putative Zn-dependent protease n=1 Tax=Allocoleopsis franciscana PCC 7113 TaxID=1173027 RepID=K9W7E2_9CYAN|nr:Zn-dependent protease [Allocoleopsis franciscana]AFZ16300.1 putative Zn-dependent protease [Allocoleopsis franciscana PCC 7113]
MTRQRLRRHRDSSWRRLLLLGVAIAASLWLILSQLQPLKAQSVTIRSDEAIGVKPGNPEYRLKTADLSSASVSLPMPQIHPLPTPLAQWQDVTDAGDYFSEIKLTPVDYLVWSQFPVKIFVDQPKDPNESSASNQRFQKWVDAVLQAVGEWNTYLPLQVVTQREGADILILRDRPPVQASLDRETGKFNIPRARSAQTRYEFYLRQTDKAAQAILSQRLTIQLSPHQTDHYTLATARHELGHALGIWGHSPLETDIMYFSQVRYSPQISVRDINTLKRIYQQPTRVGWPLAAQTRGEE